jgi:hypothetical protein
MVSVSVSVSTKKASIAHHYLKVGTLKVRYSSLRSRRLVRAEEERASSSTQANGTDV